MQAALGKSPGSCLKNLALLPENLRSYGVIESAYLTAVKHDREGLVKALAAEKTTFAEMRASVEVMKYALLRAPEAVPDIEAAIFSERIRANAYTLAAREKVANRNYLAAFQWVNAIGDQSSYNAAGRAVAENWTATNPKEAVENAVHEASNSSHGEPFLRLVVETLEGRLSSDSPMINQDLAWIDGLTQSAKIELAKHLNANRHPRIRAAAIRLQQQ